MICDCDVCVDMAMRLLSNEYALYGIDVCEAFEECYETEIPWPEHRTLCAEIP